MNSVFLRNLPIFWSGSGCGVHCSTFRWCCCVSILSISGSDTLQSIFASGESCCCGNLFFWSVYFCISLSALHRRRILSSTADLLHTLLRSHSDSRLCSFFSKMYLLWLKGQRLSRGTFVCPWMSLGGVPIFLGPYISILLRLVGHLLGKKMSPYGLV